MKPIEALELLGSKRVIWIDDHFGFDTVEALAKQLTEHLEISRQLGLTDFEPIFERIDYEDPNALADLIEMLNQAAVTERARIAQSFHAQFVAASKENVELTADQIQWVQEHLQIKPQDSLPFDKAEKLMLEHASSNDGDGHIAYIVDLQDHYGAPGNERGLDLLKVLGKSNSKAITFLLTRDATLTTEASIEDNLRAKLKEAGEINGESPICVIAKERLEGEKNVVAEGLKVAIKRAGLRRGIHDVLVRASTELRGAFDDARSSLLRIPPEQLDHYVVERAYKEGVSELHVVERALSASMSEKFKTFFATDEQVIKGAARFRDLRRIKLEPPSSPSGDLATFRRMEIWEGQELVNASFSPLACGDVFVPLREEGSENIPLERFILLVQPCDVMLRSDSGKRDFDTGVLAQISPRAPDDQSADSLKKPLLPFVLDGREWVCEFRKSATVSLAILDTATWRKDGKVQYEHGDAELPSDALLPGQLKNAKRIVKSLDAALTQRAKLAADAQEWFMPCCHLTLGGNKVFQYFATPKFVAKTIPSSSKKSQPIQTGGFSWRLQRIGRVRMPYAAALLSNYLAVQGREAFDLDYLKTTDQPCAAECSLDTTETNDGQP